MKKKLFNLSFLSSLLFMTPVFAFAAVQTTDIPTIITKIGDILKSIIPILVTLAMAYFIWGVIKYVIAGGEEDKKKGREVMIYGLIGLTVIIGIWGFVNILIGFFGGAGTTPTVEPSRQTCNLSNPAFKDILCLITKTINDSIIPLIFALATVMFIWGVVKFFIINADEEAKREQGKQYMIWGIIALAVMLSVWGLVGVLKNTFHIDVGSSILPQVKPSN